MCGRYQTNTEEEILEIKDIIHDISIRISNEEKMYLNREVSPGTNVPIITNFNNCKTLQFVKWGIDKWDNKGLIFNCKSETMNTSRFFSPIINNRCIIPAKCYYEWEHKNDKTKDKYKIEKKEEEMLFFIGLVKNDEKMTFTIITKDADENITFIHNRMPIVLKSDEVIPWLEGKLPIGEITNSNDLSSNLDYYKQ